jgi:maltose O-acetyltransferase
VQIYGRLSMYGQHARPNHLQVGDGSNIAPHCILNLDHPIRIGRTVGLAPFVRVVTTDGARAGSVTIEDGAVIMTGATILPGVVIGRGAIVAAGALVQHSVPSIVFVGGVPAEVIRQLPDEALGASPSGYRSVT